MYGISGSRRKCVTTAGFCRVDSEKVQEHTPTVNVSAEKMRVSLRIAGDPGSIRRGIRIVVPVRLGAMKTLNTLCTLKGEVNYTSSKAATMASPAPVAIPTEGVSGLPNTAPDGS